MKGIVYLVGAGPGDPGLLTIKGLECLKRSDVVIYDRLISEDLLKYPRIDTEMIYVGKEPGTKHISQDEINRIILKKALEGKSVVRLKGGDPYLFGRGGEEAEFLNENGIVFQTVPGVTSAIAAPAYAGIPLTHREHASSVHFITGHLSKDNETNGIRFELLAKVEGTLVFLMGVKNISHICKKLISYGKDKDTPAAVIENGTTHRQRVIEGTLKDIHEISVQNDIVSPAIIVIGNVVLLRKKLSQKPDRPLDGKRVVVTRPEGQAETMIKKLEELGAYVDSCPAIEICEIADKGPMDIAIASVKDYSWIIFTSANGVRYFFERMIWLSADLRGLSDVRFCVTGNATAKELSRFGFTADLIPGKYTSKSMLEALLKETGIDDRILMARSDIADPLLKKLLKENGIRCDDVPVYSCFKKSPAEVFLSQNPDFITFSSPSSVRGFVDFISHVERPDLKRAKIVCIGPVTAKEALKEGFDAVDTADMYNEDGLIEKILELSEVENGHHKQT